MRALKMLLLGVACVGLLAGQAAAATTWDLSIVWPSGNFHTKNAEIFAQKVKAATGGEVNIIVHPGGQLGIKGPEALIAVRDGIVPIADILLNQQVGEHKYFGIESLPYLAAGYDELAVLHKHFWSGVKSLVEKQFNQKALFIVPWPGQAVYSKHEIKVVADMKGFKLRVVDKNGHNFFARLGAAPLQLPWGEVVPSLASGVISGVTTSSSSGVDGKFWEFLKFMNRFNWQSSSNITSVNLDAWKKLSKKNQEAIEKLAAELQPVFLQSSKDEDTEKLKILGDNGIHISSPTPELKKDLVAVGMKMWEEFVADAGPEAGETIKRYRAEIGK